MTATPTSDPAALPAWQASDAEAIRLALVIPVSSPAIEAIYAAMAQLEQRYAEAIPSAQAELAAIGAIDQQLRQLTPAQLQAPIEVRRKAVIPETITSPPAQEGGEPVLQLPVRKADVIEYDTDLLREETIERYRAPLSDQAVLLADRRRHVDGLLQVLPDLARWSSDGRINGTAEPFSAPLQRG